MCRGDLVWTRKPAHATEAKDAICNRKLRPWTDLDCRLFEAIWKQICDGWKRQEASRSLSLSGAPLVAGIELPARKLLQSMLLWLASATRKWKSGPTANGFSAAIVSIGNDAGDLDSLVSSIAMADLQPVGGSHKGHNHTTGTKRKWSKGHNGRPLWLPVVPFARGDFRLRQDACLAFRHVGFTFDEAGAPADLLHLDEATAETAALWSGAGGLGLALVDHNACLPDVCTRFGERVVAIVDHHNDERRHVDLDEARRREPADALVAMLEGSSRTLLRTVRPDVGSTCSLLVELMESELPGGRLSARSVELRVLLLSAIAVDTRGFEPKLLGEKYCATDVRAAQELYTSLGAVVPKRLPPRERTGSEAFELVLDALLALRQVELPKAAQVGGARTLAELSARLLAARYDVSTLTTLELMRWDYKEAVRRSSSSAAAQQQQSDSDGMKVGIAAICETADELLLRSGGCVGLEAAMSEASERRSGLGVLLALTKEDDRQQGCKGLIALLPAADNVRTATEATESPREAAESLLRALAGVPTLPPALAANALFRAQRIEAKGFGIEWEQVHGAPRLWRSKLRAQATRKTLMPALLQLG